MIALLLLAVLFLGSVYLIIVDDQKFRIAGVFMAINCILQILIMRRQLIQDRYYVEWFSDELHYFMPRCKQTVKIKYSEITGIEIDKIHIDIKTAHKTYMLYMDNLMVADTREIKENMKDLAISK